jgi:hypothetical protein
MEVTMKNKRTALTLAVSSLLLPLAALAQSSFPQDQPDYPRTQQEVQENEGGAFRERDASERDGETHRHHRLRHNADRTTERNDEWTARDIRSGDPTGGSELSPSTGDPNDSGTWGPHPYGLDQEKTYTPR